MAWLHALKIHAEHHVMKSCILAAISASLLITAAGAADNTLTPDEKTGGWKLLFDGKSLAGWRPFGEPQGSAEVGPGWKVEAGVLKKLAGIKGGDIITESTFDNFELSWDWRLAEGANNGVKYLVTEQRPQAPGHEYQMIDDLDPKWAKLAPKSRTASFYDVLPPAGDAPVRKAGQWNHSRILLKGNLVEHWLNGQKVLTYELGSPAVKDAIARSKFRKYPDFGQKIRGYIMLTDHQDEAWFRNLKLLELPTN